MDITVDQLSENDAAFQAALAGRKEKVVLPAGQYNCVAADCRLKRFSNGDILFVDFIVNDANSPFNNAGFSIGYNLTKESTLFIFAKAYHLIDPESTKGRLKECVDKFMAHIVGCDCVVSAAESKDVDAQGSPYINYWLDSVGKAAPGSSDGVPF